MIWCTIGAVIILQSKSCCANGVINMTHQISWCPVGVIIVFQLLYWCAIGVVSIYHRLSCYSY